MGILFAAAALLPGGWASGVRMEWDLSGTLTAVTAGAEPDGAEQAAGAVLPGLANLHSHAFQRAMAGLTEHLADPDDGFWTWRDQMYRLALRITPEDQYAIARRLYVEMLEHGYTAVAEFHYLHHQPGGAAYDDPAEMSRQVIEAARETGIAITHLPVLYTQGGFGGRSLNAAQQRFHAGSDMVLRILDRLRPLAGPDVRLGVAPHSLRAVHPRELDALLLAVRGQDAAAPIHIHAAEQLREVNECLAATGVRPVEWLLDHTAVDRHWCLVHSTHLSDAEVRGLASSGAVAGLCPTTEANLGDGVFPLVDFRALGGRWGIGSDSNVATHPMAELTLLEYGQRLQHRRRNLAATAERPRVAENLWCEAAQGGAQALGRFAGVLEPGRRADLVVLDTEDADFSGLAPSTQLGVALFARSGPVRDVLVGGHWRVREGRHPAAPAAESEYRAVVRRLRQD